MLLEVTRHSRSTRCWVSSSRGDTARRTTRPWRRCRQRPGGAAARDTWLDLPSCSFRETNGVFSGRAPHAGLLCPCGDRGRPAGASLAGVCSQESGSGKLTSCSFPLSQAQAAPVASPQQCVTTCEVRVRARPAAWLLRRSRRRAGVILAACRLDDALTACGWRPQIRFTRLGRNKSPFFRVVVMDSRTRRDGRPLEVSLGLLPHHAPAAASPDRLFASCARCCAARCPACRQRGQLFLFAAAFAVAQSAERCQQTPVASRCCSGGLRVACSRCYPLARADISFTHSSWGGTTR